jgi:hypothetical protein
MNLKEFFILNLKYMKSDFEQSSNYDRIINDANQKPKNMVNLRNRIDEYSPAELSCQNAISQIEKMGSDVRLTNAQIKLQEAKDLLADYIIENKLTYTPKAGKDEDAIALLKKFIIEQKELAMKEYANNDKFPELSAGYAAENMAYGLILKKIDELYKQENK